MQIRLIIASLALAGCAPHQPVFVEPAWGNAPTPYTTEITEIALETRSCPPSGPRCTDSRLLFNRDGIARWEFGRKGRADSLLVGSIDSLAFIRLAEMLREKRFFSRSGTGYGHEPLAVLSYVASAATLCRRATGSYVAYEGSTEPPEIPSYILSAATQVSWSRCCRDIFIPHSK